MEKNFKEKVFNAFLDYYERANQNLTDIRSLSTIHIMGKSEYIYMKVFGEVPNLYRPGEIVCSKNKEFKRRVNKELLKKLEEEIFNNPKVIVKTDSLFLGSGGSTFLPKERKYIFCISEDKYIIELYLEENAKDNDRLSISAIYSSRPEILNELREKYFSHQLDDKKISQMKLITQGPDGFHTEIVEVKTIGFEKKNYNSDIPHEKVLKELETSGSGLMIFHGKPGCGKTTYIRSLIKDSERPFLYLDPKMLSQVTGNSSMLELLIENRGAVIIIEDCEKLIQARSSKGAESELNTLLNITDGLLGDSLDLKFICTFNSPLSTIDSALLRKGRLKVIYEFKELEKSRVNEIADMIGKKDIPNKDMAICDIYNWEPGKMEEIKTGSRKSIGFMS